MPKFRDTFMEYIGEGELHSDDKQIPIKFNCQQLWDGNIIGDIELIKGEHLIDLFQIFNKILPSKISGVTNGGLRISIESIYLTKIPIGENENIKFFAKEVKAKKREIISNESEIIINFGITNFQSFRTVVNTNVGDLIFKNLEGNEDLINDITAYKKACITGIASLIFNIEIKENSIEDYLELALKEINKVLILTSFSQGIYQTWKFIEIYEKIDGENEKIYTYNASTRDKCMNFRPVISYRNLTNYLSITYSNYTDELEERIGMCNAIDWYLESLADRVVEANYIAAFVCLELLVHRDETITSDKILNEDVFSRLREILKEASKTFFYEEGIYTQDRRSFYSNIIGLNRPPFSEQFNKLLTFYEIGCSDIFSDLKEPKTIRDNLVHGGQTGTDVDTLISNYHKLMAMNQRIILSILNYNGHSFIDWLNNNEYGQFNKDPNEEH